MPHQTVRTVSIAVAAVCATLVAMTALTPSADATAQSAAKPTAVHYIDLGRLLDGLDERTDLEKDLQTRIEDRRGQLTEISDKLQKARDNITIEKRGTETYREKVRELLELEAQAKVRQEALQTIISVEKGTLLVDLFQKISKSAEDLAKREGYDSILIDDSDGEFPPQPSEQQALNLILNRRVLYADARIDVTDNLRTQMNNAYRAGRP